MNATSSSVRLGAMDLYHPLPCPDGWTTRRLRFVTQINKAQPITLSPEDEVSFVPMAAIGEHGGIQLDQVKALDEIGDGYTYFADGDVVVAKITPCFENGKGAFAESLKNGIAFGTTELHVIRPTQDIDGCFLFYLTSSELFRELGEGAMYGAGGQKRVPDQFIKDFQALVPPLDQQQKIAAFLDRKTAEIDTLIAKKRRLLDRLAEKRTALITRAVTKGLDLDAPMKDSGIEWLGEIPAHWEVAPIKRDKKLLTSGSRGWATHYSDDGDLFLRIANLTRDSIRLNLLNIQHVMAPDGTEAERSKVQEGDVLFSITAYLGSVAVVPQGIGKAYVSQHLALFRLMQKLFLPDWIGLCAISDVGKDYLASRGYGGTKIQLSLDDVDQFIVPVPSIDEQKQIRSFIGDEQGKILVSKEKIEKVIHRLEEYRSALITNAVTGLIKVA